MQVQQTIQRGELYTHAILSEFYKQNNCGPKNTNTHHINQVG